MRKLALHWKIIIGMVLGVLYGLLASEMGWVDFTNDWIKPWGKIFINLLKVDCCSSSIRISYKRSE